MFFRRDFYNDLNTNDPFATLMQQQGHIYRQVKGRKTLRFVVKDHPYFVKLFSGISIGELLKNLIKGQLPVADVSHERQALEKLATLGIDVPQIVAYGNDQASILRRRSFIVMEAVEPSISLDEYLYGWKNKPLLLRRALIKKVAEIARTVHQQGIQHRDFYICHFLLRIPYGEHALNPENLDVALIDWHRARFKTPLPNRWQIKDLAALFFSTLATPLSWRDYLRFLQAYTQQPLRTILPDPLWKKVNRKALRLYRKIYLPRNFHKRIVVDQDIVSPKITGCQNNPW